MHGVISQTFLRKKHSEKFCIQRGQCSTKEKGASWRYMDNFEKEHPSIAKEYFDIRYEDLISYK